MHTVGPYGVALWRRRKRKGLTESLIFAVAVVDNVAHVHTVETGFGLGLHANDGGAGAPGPARASRHS